MNSIRFSLDQGGFKLICQEAPRKNRSCNRGKARFADSLLHAAVACNQAASTYGDIGNCCSDHWSVAAVAGAAAAVAGGGAAVAGATVAAAGVGIGGGAAAAAGAVVAACLQIYGDGHQVVMCLDIRVKARVIRCG